MVSHVRTPAVCEFDSGLRAYDLKSASGGCLFDYLEVYPLRGRARLLARGRVRDDDLKDVLARRGLRPEAHAPAGQNVLRVALRPRGDGHLLARVDLSPVAEQARLQGQARLGSLLLDARVVDGEVVEEFRPA